MEISGAHHQLMASHPLDEVFANSNPRPSNHLMHHQIAHGQLISESQPPAQNQQNQRNQQPQNNDQQPKKPRPHPDQALKCPRCDSTNTKFCYYNNYSLSQPRYFCKGCRRYWTQGGSLRNVPVGGGCRKNKRASPSPRNSSPTPKKIQENPQGIVSNTNPNSNPNPNPLFSPLLPPGPESQHSGLAFNPSDLSLAFACNLSKPSVVIPQLPDGYGNPSGFLDILRGGGFVESNANSTTAGAASSVANGFPSFYLNYNLGSNHANGAGPENPRDINIVMPAIDGTATSVSGTDAGGTAASGSDSLVMQGGNNSSCKASVDGGGLQLEQQQQLGQGDVVGTTGNLSTFAVDSSSGRDYWNVNTVGASSPWQSIMNSSLL